jgi:uncharacterized membrane-anchored protein
MRKIIIVLTGLIILSAVNFTIYEREQLHSQGRMVLLELAPVDPRSLMQGDYMALNYAVANAAFPGRQVKDGKDGYIVVALDERGVGQFKRLADTTTLVANEALLRYRIRNEQIKFATNAFFFEEGKGQSYQAARYGEFRVSTDGEMLLINLRSADLAVLGASS